MPHQGRGSKSLKSDVQILIAIILRQRTESAVPTVLLLVQIQSTATMDRDVQILVVTILLR